MPALRIVLACILASVAYGIVHDQVTARVCVEYFTVGHPPIFGDTDDPTLLALGWGVVASWWVGLILGILLALAARAGARPPLEPGQLVRPILVLLGFMAICAIVAGFAGWRLAEAGKIGLPSPLRWEVPLEKHPAFLADLWAHSASYAIGFVGGGAVIWRVIQRRKRMARNHP